ncbi:unnamed protein product [Linum trigynum]|uniref:Replication factor A C-terminal domain-containing protein n=1 Tax=Linum trigynum TaxID=586398 RepID=A0AAV2GIX2_9ROSI
MNHVVLSKLAWTDKSPAVKLRLLHTWMAGNPSRPDGFSEYATLWTDELGVLVQGLASKHLSEQLKEVLSVGKIYFVTQFSQREAKKRWAPCSNDRLLHFTSSTTFVLADEDASSFCADSFEFRRFEDLHGIASRAEHLVDAVGRLVSATPVTYFQKQHRSIKKQAVVIENERGASLPVTLWAEFADKLPLAELIQLDGAAPIVVAFTSLNLSLWRGNVGASNTSATRIVIRPTVLEAQSLALHFGYVIGAIGIVPVENDTPEKAATVYHESFKTITELQTIQSTSTMGGRFRCKATITDIDMSRDWCYLGCAVCSKAAIRRDAPFWCEKCDVTVHPHQLKQCFRIRFMVHDGTAFTPFLVLGQTADSLLGVSAASLFAAAPDRGAGYPPEIEELVGKEYIFLLYLPVGQVSDSMDDMVVSSIEKDEQPAFIDRQPHGPQFQKRHSATIATVPQLMPPRSTNYIQHAPSNSSDITVFASPTKRLRDVSPSTSMVDNPVSQEHTEFRAPRPVQTLDMSTFASPTIAAALTSVLSTNNVSSTPIKPSEHSAPSSLLAGLQTPNSKGLSSPLAGINIATPSSSEKKKDKLSDTAHVEPHQLLSRPADIAITVAAGLGNTAIHEKPLPSAALLKDIPPSMMPINPLSHPLAKVKVEKLQYSRKDAKNSKDSDTLPISHLKTKVSKGKGVAKKLFQG